MVRFISITWAPVGVGYFWDSLEERIQHTWTHKLHLAGMMVPV